jgi:hypothetical protein
MKNNTTFIIGLICIIWVTVILDSSFIKKEGFVAIDCTALLNIINETLQNTEIIKQMDTINKTGINGQFTELNLFFSLVDIMDGILKTYPKTFEDIFSSPKISDDDFIVFANSYTQFIYFLNNIRMIIILINPTFPATIKIPITKNLVIINSKTEYAKFISDVNTNNTNVVDTLQSILNKINKYNIISSNTNVDLTTVELISNVFHVIRDTKRICKGIKEILSNMDDYRLEIVSPFMNLISDYMKHIINLLNYYFVPALNAKIKDGAFRIQIDEISQLSASNVGVSPIIDKANPSAPTVNIGSLLTQGLITAKP